MQRDYEQQLGEKARRIIPIKVRVTNQSDEPVAAPIWSVGVDHGDGRKTEFWEQAPDWPDELAPRQIVDRRLVWDGKSFGSFVDVGDYVVVLSAKGLTLRQPLKIWDEGPNVHREPTQIEKQNAIGRWSQRLSDGIRWLSGQRRN